MLENGVVEIPLVGYRVDYNERIRDSRKIWKFPDSFYEEKSIVFPQRPDTVTIGLPIIKESQKEMLREIKEILVRNNANYKIILNPMYDQIIFAPEDKEYLIDLFGENNVVDFTGKNRITDDYHYYRDPGHFNEYVASEVMCIAYEQDSCRRQRMLDSLYYK